MKKKRLLFLLPLIASFALTACDLSSLMPNTPRRRSSKEESSEIDDSTYRRSSNNPSTSKYSYHTHSWGDWYVVLEPTCEEYGLEERKCVECGVTQQASISPRGHTWSEWEDLIAATCINPGIRRHYCVVCSVEQQEEVPPMGHQYDENNVIWSQQPNCIQEGRGQVRCQVCGEMQEIYQPAYGHDVFLVGGDVQPASGKAAVRVYKCRRCDTTFMGFKATDVTDESKQHLVFEENWGVEVGAKFWGRPIGNAMALNSDGTSVNQQDGECVYCSIETGDFFEYVFDLTAEQAAVLETCRLYVDAKPADYLNGTDFWAYGSSNAEWTPGHYIDGADEHIKKDSSGNPIMVKDHARATEYSQPGQELSYEVPMGKRIEKYRYALYVDGQFQDFDPDTACPTHGTNTNMQREEFELPYTFHLHQGENRISLHMAGGYRSTFYNFVFRPYVEPTPITVNETSIEVREGQTAQITSSMTGLTYKSSSTSVCRVDANGVITGVKVGTATITVSKEGNYKDAKIPVTVLEKEGVVVLNPSSGAIVPDGGVEFYNSTSSGEWIRNFQQGVTLTYTFQSEFAEQFNIQMGLRGSNIVLADNFTVKVNGVDVALSGVVSTQYSAVDYIVGQTDLIVGENTMVITAIQYNSLYLKSIKLIPVSSEPELELDPYSGHSFVARATVNNSLGKPVSSIYCTECGISGYQMNFLDCDSPDRVSNGKVSNNSALTWKFKNVEPGTYSFMMCAKCNSGRDNPFTDESLGRGVYQIFAGGVEGTITVAGKKLGDFGATTENAVYFEMGIVSISTNQINDNGEIDITVNYPQQDYRHVYDGAVRLIKN